MSRNLTASDRSALIRLASTMPVGSAERRAILESITSRSRRASLYDRNLVDAAVDLVYKDWGPLDFGNLPFKVWTETHNYGGRLNKRDWEIPESYDFDMELTLPSDIVSQVDPDDVEHFMGYVMDEFIHRTTPLGFVKELLNHRSRKSQGTMLDPIMDSIRPTGAVSDGYRSAINEFRVEGVKEVGMYPKEGTLKKGPSSYSIEIECLIRGLDLLVVLDEAVVWDD